MYKTGNPVPSNDMRDLADNAKTLDDIIHSSNDIVQTRTGRQIQTATGFERRLNAAIQSGPVTSVNGKRGEVKLHAEDVGALTKENADKIYMPKDYQPPEIEFPVTSINGKRGEVYLDMPVYRLTKNQAGIVSNNFLNGFAKNPSINITISIHREIFTGVDWDKRDNEEREILTAMGIVGKKYFEPSPIRVIKMQWSDWHNPKDFYTIYPGHQISFTGVTTASYAKLISGKMDGHWVNGVNEKWGLCGCYRMPDSPGLYQFNHALVRSESGEVLFIWPAVVAGYVPLDRNNPKWGFYPYIGDQKDD